MALGIFNTVVLCLLAFFHFYWAAGGKFGLLKTVPTDHGGKTMLNPGPVSCLIVGFVLTFIALLMGLESKIIAWKINSTFVHYCTLIVSGIFILRAIGDFKYVGFTKSVKGTGFSKMDTRYYSPLVLIIGLAGLYISLV